MTLIKIPMNEHYDLKVLGTGIETFLTEYEGQQGAVSTLDNPYATVKFSGYARYVEEAEDVLTPWLLQKFERWLRDVEKVNGIEGIEWRVRPTIAVWMTCYPMSGDIRKLSHWLPRWAVKPWYGELRFRYDLRYTHQPASVYHVERRAAELIDLAV